MVPRCLHYEVRKGLHQRQNGVIGMLRFDSELRKSGAVKVYQIERDDHACAAQNRGSEDVTIIPIRQLN